MSDDTRDHFELIENDSGETSAAGIDPYRSFNFRVDMSASTGLGDLGGDWIVGGTGRDSASPLAFDDLELATDGIESAVGGFSDVSGIGIEIVDPGY